MSIHPERTYPPLLAHGQTWEEMTAGSAFRTAARTITETDLITFVTWSGFTEALFLDASHAAAGGYTGRLVPGALVYCIGEGLVLQTNVLNGTGLAFMSMDLTIKRPVYVGDTLHVVVEVTEARAASNGPRGVVTTRNSVRNQRDEDVLIYTPVRLIRGRDYQDQDLSAERPRLSAQATAHAGPAPPAPARTRPARTRPAPAAPWHRPAPAPPGGIMLLTS
jgi:acyl dehydratase